MTLGDQAKRALDNITTSAKKGDEGGVQNGIPDLEKAIKDLTEKVNEEAKGQSPERQQQIAEANKKIAETLPVYEEVAKRLAKNPRDPQLNGFFFSL